MATLLSSFLLLLFVFVFFYLRLPQFGKAPAKNRLKRIQHSPNYKNGKFQNKHFTPSFTKGYSPIRIIYDMFFKKHPGTVPIDSIPSIKNNLHQLPSDEDVLIWFGHSSYYIQAGGYNFLVDPVFSQNASPIPTSNKSFKGTDIYSAADMPEIDFLLITHDHYDHLDYLTIIGLKNKVKNVICGLGVGSHFEHWGFDMANVIEKDWNESIKFSDKLQIYTAPARHFSGRGLKRNNTLWLSFILQIADKNIYIGGDSGYDTHFAEIGHKFGRFDLAILENGQYNEAWRAIHLMPEEVLKAAKELNTQCLFPVHS